MLTEDASCKRQNYNNKISVGGGADENIWDLFFAVVEIWRIYLEFTKMYSFPSSFTFLSAHFTLLNFPFQKNPKLNPPIT